MTPYMTIPVWVIPAAVNAVVTLCCVMDWRAINDACNMRQWKYSPPRPTWWDYAKVGVLFLVCTAAIWLAYAVYWVVWWNTGGAMR